MEQIVRNESVFAEEREFFLKRSLKDQELQSTLLSEIEHLKNELKDEKLYAYDLFIKEEVSKTCSRAISRYATVTDRMKIDSSTVRLE